jgi:hypothetical protein
MKTALSQAEGLLPNSGMDFYYVVSDASIWHHVKEFLFSFAAVFFNMTTATYMRITSFNGHSMGCYAAVMPVRSHNWR